MNKLNKLIVIVGVYMFMFALFTKDVSANAKYGRILEYIHIESIEQFNQENKPIFEVVDEGPSRGDEVIEYKIENFIIQDSVVPFNILQEEVIEEDGEIVYDNRPSQDEIDEQKEVIKNAIANAENEDTPMKIGVGIIIASWTIVLISEKIYTKPYLVV